MKELSKMTADEIKEAIWDNNCCRATVGGPYHYENDVLRKQLYRLSGEVLGNHEEHCKAFIQKRIGGELKITVLDERGEIKK